jgi:hypothetical protein
MNIIFAVPTDDGIFPGYEDAKYLAKKNSGCDVFCLDKSHSGKHDLQFVELIADRPRKGKLDIMAIRRTLMALDFIEATNLGPPYVLPDWDFLIFTNLVAAFEPFMDYDWATGIHNDGNMMPAHFVTNLEAIKDFAKVTMRMADDLPIHEYQNCFHDMMIWKAVCDSRKFKVGNTATVVNGSTFDCGMGCHKPDELPVGFKSDQDGYKKLSWVDRVPYFETLSGETVRANWIHCWGKYKTMTKELRRKSE